MNLDLDDLDDDAPLAQVDEALAQGVLTMRQVRALAVRHAAPDKSNVQVSRISGIPLRTLQFWLSRPFFAELWSDQEQRHRAVVQALRAEGDIKSLNTLMRVQGMDFALVPASVQVDAAAKLLTSNQRDREHETPSAGQWLSSGMWRELAAESAAMLAVEGEAHHADP